MKKSKILIIAFLFVFIGLLFSGFKVSADVQTSDQITIQGAQVRTAGSAGIRFVGYVDTDLATDEISAYGMAIAFGDVNVADIVIGATVNDKSVLSAQVSSITSDNNYYINLVDIPNTMYGQKVTARAYYVSNGKTIYSDVSTTRSLGQVTLAVKASGSSTDLIESIYTDLSTNYKNVYTDELGNVFVTSSVYETNPKKLEKEFVADWNNKFGTTMESFDYTTWQTSAKNGTTPLTIALYVENANSSGVTKERELTISSFDASFLTRRGRFAVVVRVDRWSALSTFVLPLRKTLRRRRAFFRAGSLKNGRV